MPTKFQSEQLQTAFENSKNTLENINKIKDDVSNDIKSLEAYLKEINLNEDYDYKVSGSEMTLDATYLRWNNEKKRLMYLETRFPIEDYENQEERCSIADMYPFEPKKTIVERPLIEMPFETRKIAYFNLSDFLLSLSKKYEIEQSKTDCPF